MCCYKINNFRWDINDSGTLQNAFVFTNVGRHLTKIIDTRLNIYFYFPVIILFKECQANIKYNRIPHRDKQSLAKPKKDTYKQNQTLIFFHSVSEEISEGIGSCFLLIEQTLTELKKISNLATATPQSISSNRADRCRLELSITNNLLLRQRPFFKKIIYALIQHTV